ncbi:hypothetical protein LCGC14_1482920, partial [marine sediment metagenome]
MSNDIEKKYLEIINNLDIGFFRGEFKGKLLMHNQAINKLLGFDPSTDLTGSLASAFLTNPEEQTRYYNELLKNGYIRDYITEIKKVNGEIITVQINAHIVKESDNKPLTIEGTVADITEKYILEQKLNESESKLRGIMSSITDQVSIIDKHFDILYLNDKAEELYGSSALGSKCFQVYHGFNEPCSDCQMRRTFEDGQVHHKECLREIGGESRYCWCTSNVFETDKKGHPISVLEVSRDITERKKAEEMLKEAELRYHTTFEQSPDGIMIIDPETTRTIKFNDAMCNLLGYTREEFAKLKVPDYDATENPSDTKTHVEKVLKEGRDDFETKMCTKEGDIKDIFTTAKVIELSGKLYLQSICRDITERKKTEMALRKSEHKFHTLFENMLDGFAFCKIIIDDDNNPIDFVYLEVNDAFERLTGLKKEETIGRRVTEVIPDIKNSKPNLFEIYGKVALTGESTKFEIFFEPLKIWLLISVYSLEKNYFVTVFDNITERKRAEQKLKESEQKLTERVKELTSLYEISKLVETLDIPLEDLILGTLNIIPSAYQFPDITRARIIYKDRVYSLENFRETKWKMSIKMMILKFPILIEVCYLENKSFISEEYDLLIEIGTQLKRILDGREIQRKLKESEETYRLLFESSTDGIASADTEGNFIDINKAFLDLLGYSREELLKLNFRDITPQKWHEMEDNLLIKQLSEEKDSGIYEKEYIQKDGTIIPIDIRFWIVKDNQGDPIRMWFIVRDITDRKIVEKEISDLAKFPSENPNPVLRATQNRILYANKSGIELLKVDIEGNIPEFLHEIIQESLSKNIKQELDIELANQIYSFTISPIKAMGYVNIYGINITDRIKAEEEIASLAKFPSEDPYPVLRVNLNNVLYINNAGQKLLKIDDNDEIPEIFRVKIDEAFINNAITEVEAILNSRIYSFNIIPIRGSNYVNIYGMDITERKQVEQKLKEVNKLKSEFLRRASHELKTPLISIKGFSDLILSLYSDQLDIP